MRILCKQACVVASLALLVSAASPSKTSTNRNECYMCNNLSDWGGHWYHQFGSWGVLFTGPPHTAEVYGGCETEHDGCELTLNEQGGYKGVEAMVAADAWEGLQRLITLVPTVHFNAERRSIQVENCDHEVVANYELSTFASERLTQTQ